MKRASSGRRLARRLLRGLARLLSLVLLRLEVRGRENLPPHGPLIVVSNHFGWLEPALLPVCLPYELEFLAADTMFEHRWVGWILRLYGGIPIQRGTVDRRALAAAASVLQGNGVLVVFPEGGVGSHGFRSQLIPARRGTAYLATQQASQLLPVAFSGSGSPVFAYWKRLHRAPVSVCIGSPFGPLTADGHGATRREALADASTAIMAQIARMLPVAERGPYERVLQDGGRDG